MTAGGFAVQVTDFAAEAPKFTDAGNELANATTKQSAALNALGAFWGTTAHGPDFGKQYQQYETKILALAKACGIALQGIGDGLQGMGKQYGITEDQITKAMQGSLGEMAAPKGEGEGAG